MPDYTGRIKVIAVSLRVSGKNNVVSHDNVVSHGLNRNDMTIYYMKITDYDFL